MRILLDVGTPFAAGIGGILQVVRELCQVEGWLVGYGETHEPPPNADRVNKWTGVVNSNEAVQTTGSLMPTSDGTRMLWDGNDDYLENTSSIGSAYGSNVSEFWSAAVFRYDGFTDSGLWSFGLTSRTLVLGYSLVLSGGGIFADINAGETRIHNAFSDTTSYHVGILQITGGVFTIWIDGAEFASGAVVSNPDLGGLTLRLGTRYTGGVYAAHDGPTKAILFGTTLTTTQRQRLEAALTAEYL